MKVQSIGEREFTFWQGISMAPMELARGLCVERANRKLEFGPLPAHLDSLELAKCVGSKHW